MIHYKLRYTCRDRFNNSKVTYVAWPEFQTKDEAKDYLNNEILWTLQNKPARCSFNLVYSAELIEVTDQVIENIEISKEN